jgi:hypothetical protein
LGFSPACGIQAEFAGFLTKIKDFAVRLEACGKGGPSDRRAFGGQGAHHMTDGTCSDPRLADLIAAASPEAEADWDLSALVDWPHIAPAREPVSTAGPQAGTA